MEGRFEDFDVGAGDFASTATEPGDADTDPVGAHAFADLGPAPWVAIGLVLVLIGVLVSPVPAMRDRAIVPTLGDAPRQVWSVALHSVRASEGDLWIAEEKIVAAAQNSIRGADILTGAIAWETRGISLRCALQAPDIACVSDQGQRAELVQLTTDAGQVSRNSMPFLVSAVPHDGGLITLWEEIGAVTVTRWGPAGEHVWDRELSTGSAEVDWPGVRAAVVGDSVLISAADSEGAELGLPALDVEDGTAHEDLLVRSSDGDEWLVDDGGELALYGASGQRWPVGNASMPVDDNPGADVVFDLTSAAVQARSLTADDVIWDFSPADSGDPEPRARVGDVLVVWSDGYLHGLDLADGSLQWRQGSPAPTCPCYAGGSVMTHVTWQEDVLLNGLDVTSGETAWQIPVGSTRSFAYDTDGSHLALATNYDLTLWRLD